jgi:2,3-bisphosphoglycerate-independent phosphoglycerate mutase
MAKTIVILTDGMADEPLAELDGKTPLEHGHTPHMDAIAAAGASGTFFSLPAGFPTSSDVANMSVMGYDLAKNYCGRGPLEAVSQGIDLGPHDVAFRCNLIHADGDTLIDYSGGHIDNDLSRQLISALKDEFDCDDYTFHPGVSYRNLLICHGPQFSDQVNYHKADAAQGMRIPDILLTPADDSDAARNTCEVLNDLTLRSRALLESHPINQSLKVAANSIWPFSPGGAPSLRPFAEKYGVSGAIISAVDVIFGLGACAGMEIIRVEGATGFLDTNYEGKAEAAVAALDEHDFVYLHVEAADECGHIGDLKLKLQAIEDIDRRLVGRVRQLLGDRDVTLAVLPDHPVPIRLRVHTRDPVPFIVAGSHIEPDDISVYSETQAPLGSLGMLQGDEFMRLVINV